MSPDWKNSKTGQVLRACEIPEQCGCDTGLIPCGCAGPCDCHPLPPRPCGHVLGREHGYTLEKWARLLSLFDPDEYDEPPAPPAKALMLSHEDSVRVMSARFGARKNLRTRAQRLKGLCGLRHPDDVYPTHGTADEVSVRGEKNRKEGSLKTNPLSPLERTLLESLEAQILPAYHLWPWTRAGARWLPQAARALEEVRSRRLFRELRLTFELYAFDIWGWQARDLGRIFAGAAEAPTALPPRRAA